MQNVSEHSTSLGNTDGGDRQQLKDDADNNSFSANTRKSSRKRKQEEVHEQGGDDGKEDTSSLKKPRVVWSVELHQKFVDALDHIGIHKAVPKNILERMNVPGLTRDNIASHLQKYRIYLKHQGHTNRSFATAPDPTFGPVSALNGFDLQALAVAGQLRAPSLAQLQAAGLGRPSSLTNPGVSVSPLVDQRNVFSFQNPKVRFGHGHGQMLNSGGGSSKQMSLLHDVPTGNMRVHQQQIVGQNVQSSGMLMPIGGGPSMLPSFRQQQQQPAPSTSLNHMNQIYMNGGSVRVKSEKVVETETFPIATTLFGQQYNQEDLMSPLLHFDGNSIK